MSVHGIIGFAGIIAACGIMGLTLYIVVGSLIGYARRRAARRRLAEPPTLYLVPRERMQDEDRR